jgi:hypothetical protein
MGKNAAGLERCRGQIITSDIVENLLPLSVGKRIREFQASHA